jgi:glycosyl transferase family 7 (putative galactosyltransferase)/glycosyl transferase-like sugar-binding protein
MTRAVILVPRREDGGHRDRVWAWVRAWWERELPELAIFEGHHDEGLFNRSSACNRAAALAGDWDVALLIDADVICDPAQVREAIEVAHATRDHLVLAFTRRHNLNLRGSERIMAGDRGSWQRYIAKTYTEMCSSVVAIPRQLWDTVGGFDERFAGWGFEDTAFACAAETFGTTLEKIDGECWHLWHPSAPEGRRDAPSYQANRTRREQYSASLGDRDAIRALQRGEDVVLRPNQRAQESIPRILHRVVPEVSPPEAEEWWERFGELHPDWTLMTHRDPLKPKEWPLTARHWGKCRTGAQLAGLIRLEALWRWGGIYVDQDVEPFRSLEPLLSLHAFAAWEDQRCVPDAVLGAEPEHPAIRRCLDLAIKRLPLGTWKSGAGVTTEVLPNRSDVMLLPPASFYAIHYRDPERETKMAHFDATQEPWAFALHRYWGSWLAQDGAA